MGEANTAAMTNVQAIKLYFARKDSLSPEGQQVTARDFQGLDKGAREEMAEMAREELRAPTVKVLGD